MTNVNPFMTIGMFYKVDNVGQDGPLCIIKGYTCYKYHNNCISFQFCIILANSADPNEMPHDTAFHFGLNCLPKYSFRAFPSTKS